MTKKKAVSKLSVISFISGLLGFLFPLAIVFGHLAFRDIRRHDKAGKLLAMIGLVLGYVALFSCLAMLGFFFDRPASPNGVTVTIEEPSRN